MLLHFKKHFAFSLIKHTNIFIVHYEVRVLIFTQNFRNTCQVFLSDYDSHWTCVPFFFFFNSAARLLLYLWHYSKTLHLNIHPISILWGCYAVIIKSSSYAFSFRVLFYKTKQERNLVLCFPLCWFYWRSKVWVDVMVHQGGWLGGHSNFPPLLYISPSPTYTRTLTLSIVPSIVWINPIPWHQCRAYSVSHLLSPPLLQPMNYQGPFFVLFPSAIHCYNPAYIAKQLFSLPREKKNSFSFYFKMLHEVEVSESLIT